MKNHLLLFLVTLIIFASCKKSPDKPDRELAKQYFSAYTEGLVYEDDPVIFRLLRGPEVDESKLASAVRINPDVPFTVGFDSVRREIAITPKSTWPRGKELLIEIDLEQWIRQAKDDAMTIRVKVHPQEIEIIRQGMTIDKAKKSFTVLQVSTALAETPESIASLFDIPNDQVVVTSITPRQFTVKIAADPGKPDQKVNWDGESIAASQSGQIQIYKYDPEKFEVVNTYFDRVKRQYHVYFSQLLDDSGDQAGFVTLNNQSANFDIDENVLTVYIGNLNKENQTLRVSDALKSKEGLRLKSQLTYDVEIDLVHPEITWLGSGTYIPSEGQLIVPVKAKGLRSVHLQVIKMPSENTSRFAAWNQLSNIDLMELKRYGRAEKDTTIVLTTSIQKAQSWNEYGLDLSGMFSREKGMVYTLLLSFAPSHTILDCDDPDLKAYEAEKIMDGFFDEPYAYHQNYYWRYDYKERNNPCHVSYYGRREAIIKNIHCTNVFPVVKKAGNDLHIALKEIMTNEVASGANIEVLNLQGLKIKNAKTSSEGLVRFENLKTQARAIQVQYNGEVSYFNLDPNNTLSLTEFDISSEVRDIDNQIFVYTERDIWRPGDTIFLDVMLNSARFDFQEGLPISVELVNPKNVVYSKSLQSIDSKSIYSFSLPTDLEAPTGYWYARIKIGPHQKSKSLRVETIKPNVVELTHAFDNIEDDWIYDATLSGDMTVEYLAGYPMKNGDVTTDAIITAIESPFSDYRQYTFLPDNRRTPRTEEGFITANTDASGRANINTNLDFTSMGGVCRMILDSKIDLPGGGLNTQTRSYTVSPFEQYVGIKTTTGRGWRGSFNYGEQPIIEIVNVDQSGKKIQGTSQANITVYKYEKDWWYDRYRLTRGHNYHTSERLTLKFRELAEFENGTYTFRHDTDSLASGTYKIVANDPHSGHVAEYVYHCVTSDSYTPDINPQILQLTTDKESYTSGEDITVELPNLPNAKALVSIEVGQKVRSIFWSDLKTQTLKIKVEESWTPNVFLCMHVIQPYGEADNDRPMRMYAVKKLKINTGSQPLTPLIEGPDKSEPNSNLSLTVSEENGRDMEYTIALVDRGLLNITGFKTPDPQAHFDKMIALRIQTWDMFEDLIQVMNPSFAGIISIGGDAALKNLMDESADFNRFEPVVFHKGPFQLKAGQRQTHEFAIPNYIGQLRAMVVAAGENLFGHEEKSVRIVSPLMVQTQLPRALNINDTVVIPLTLFKDDQSISEVNLNLEDKENKVKFSSTSSKVSMSNEDQKQTSIDMYVGNEAGTADLSITGKAGRHEANEETKIFINYPNSYSSKTDYFEIPPGEKKSFSVSSFGFPETQHLDLTISGVLMPEFMAMYSDLIEYPHGCLEQLTSKGMALLFIDDLILLAPHEKLKQADYIDVTIRKIQSYQRSDGGFSYWPGRYYHVWSNLYAGLFLQMASERDHIVSDGVLANWKDRVITDANAWQISGTMTRPYMIRREELAQAFRLYVLARAGSAQKSAMNRFRQRTDLSAMSKALLAGAYHFAGIKDLGKNLFEEALKESPGSWNVGYYWGSRVRNQALFLAIGAEIAPELITRRYYREWVKSVNERRWLSTQEQGFCFYAAQAYLGANAKRSEEIEVQLASEKYNERYKHPGDDNRRFSWRAGELSGTAEVTNLGPTPIFVQRTERAISTELYLPPSSSNLALKVGYTTVDGRNALTESLTQGEEVYITAQVTNQTNTDIDDIALSVKAPSGWEILNPRIFESAELKNDPYTYQDYRDDRIYTYFPLSKTGSYQSKTFRFKCRVQLKGDFYLPAVTAGDMYDLEIFASTRANRVEVR